MVSRILRYASGVAVIAATSSLSGCGGDSETVAGAANSQKRVVVTVSGAVSSTLETRGSIFCGPGEGGEADYMFELYAMATPESFNLRMNRSLTPGEHPIVGSDDTARYRGADAYFYYRGPDRQNFDKVQSGTIVIESVPTAPGESLVASIEAAMTDDDGAAITLQADIDVTAGSQSFDECP